jgi:DNA-binding NtrC family response regulator
MGTALVTRRMEERLDSGPSRKVLLVDENAEDLHAYTEVLRRQGCDVRACDSFREGQGCLEAGSFDLVIVSQGSHAFEGRPLLERAIETDREVPVVVVATSVDIQAYLDAMQLGARDYIEKPLSASQLVDMVRRFPPPCASAA